jgi:hypothetical protein
VTTIVACMVCAGPFESLLSSGLHAGVLAMAVVTVAVLAALVRGGVLLVREERRAEAERLHDPGGHS